MYESSLIRSLIPSNREHIHFCCVRLVDTVQHARNSGMEINKLIVLGIAFKADTGDLRESAVPIFINEFSGRGDMLVDVYTYDPNVELVENIVNGTPIQTLSKSGRIQNAVIAVTQWNDAYYDVLNRVDVESCVLLDMYNVPHLPNSTLKRVGLTW